MCGFNLHFYSISGGDRMRVGITEDDANSAVSSLAKWAAMLVEIITALRNFLASIGLLKDEEKEENAEVVS